MLHFGVLCSFYFTLLVLLFFTGRDGRDGMQGPPGTPGKCWYLPYSPRNQARAPYLEKKNIQSGIHDNNDDNNNHPSFQCHDIQKRSKWKSKPVESRSPESGKWKEVNIQRPSPRFGWKCFTQIYRALYGDSMLELIRMSSNMADGNQQKHRLPNLLQKREFTPSGTHKH